MLVYILSRLGSIRRGLACYSISITPWQYSARQRRGLACHSVSFHALAAPRAGCGPRSWPCFFARTAAAMRGEGGDFLVGVSARVTRRVPCGRSAASRRPAGHSVPLPTSRHARPSVRIGEIPTPSGPCVQPGRESANALATSRLPRGAQHPPPGLSAAPASPILARLRRCGGLEAPGPTQAAGILARLHRALRPESADSAESPQKRRPLRQAVSGRLGSRRFRR